MVVSLVNFRKGNRQGYYNPFPGKRKEGICNSSGKGHGNFSPNFSLLRKYFTKTGAFLPEKYGFLPGLRNDSGESLLFASWSYDHEEPFYNLF